MSPSSPSIVYLINNTDRTIQCKANSSNFNLERYTMSYIVLNQPNKAENIFDKIKKRFKQHILKIVWGSESAKINLKRYLEKNMFNLRFSKYIKDICVKEQYVINKENSSYYDVIVELETNGQLSRESSVTDLSTRSSVKSQSENCYPQKQKIYSKKYFPINQEQALYIESRSSRTQRLSSNHLYFRKLSEGSN